jgi:hypothetical protein
MDVHEGQTWNCDSIQEFYRMTMNIHGIDFPPNGAVTQVDYLKFSDNKGLKFSKSLYIKKVNYILLSRHCGTFAH